jgi:hypothetical protein
MRFLICLCNKIVCFALMFSFALLSCAIKLPVQRYHVRTYVMQTDRYGRIYPRFVKDEPADVVLSDGDTIRKYLKN